MVYHDFNIFQQPESWCARIEPQKNKGLPPNMCKNASDMMNMDEHGGFPKIGLLS